MYVRKKPLVLLLSLWAVPPYTQVAVQLEVRAEMVSTHFGAPLSARGKLHRRGWLRPGSPTILP